MSERAFQNHYDRVETNHIGVELTRIATPRRTEYLIVFSTIVVSVSWVADIGNDVIQYAFYFSAFLGIILSLRMRFYPVFILMVAGLLISTVVVMLAQQGFGQWRNIYILSNMILAIMITGVFQGRGLAFMVAYNNIIYVLTMISLVTLPFLLIQQHILLKVPEFALGAIEHKEHRNLFTLFGLSYFVSVGPHFVWRNQSIFWEPGLMACMLIIALMMSSALNEPVRRQFVYVIGIFTTFSPGGYAILAVLLMLKMAKTLNRGQFFHLTLGSMTLVLCYLSLPMLRDIVLYIFSRDIQDDPSVLIRSTDFWLPFWLARESPFWGHSSFESYKSAMNIFIMREREGISNSFGEYFYRFGILWALVWAVMMSIGLKGFHRLPGYSFPILVLVTIYEPIGFSLFLFVLIFMGLNNQSGGYLALRKFRLVPCKVMYHSGAGVVRFSRFRPALGKDPGSKSSL